jgi:hypothetical protein
MKIKIKYLPFLILLIGLCIATITLDTAPGLAFLIFWTGPFLLFHFLFFIYNLFLFSKIKTERAVLTKRFVSTFIVITIVPVLLMPSSCPSGISFTPLILSLYQSPNFYNTPLFCLETYDVQWYAYMSFRISVIIMIFSNIYLVHRIYNKVKTLQSVPTQSAKNL